MKDLFSVDYNLLNNLFKAIDPGLSILKTDTHYQLKIPFVNISLIITKEGRMYSEKNIAIVNNYLDAHINQTIIEFI